MSEITVKMFPAKDGDCFLVSLGDIKKNHILIDCGYAETYNNFLKQELQEISHIGECIDLMIITHIDQDHISGAISFLKDNNENHFIKINEIWHNSYKHLQFKNKVEKITPYEKNLLENEIRLGISFINMSYENIKNEYISARQGSSLASLILEGNYSWNESFEYNSVNIDNRILINKNDYKIYLLSPNTDKLNKLSNTWLRYLKTLKWNFNLTDETIFDDAYEFHMIKQREKEVNEKNISLTKKSVIQDIMDVDFESPDEITDNSITNGSSISFILEYCGKKLLFLADAHPDIIEDNLSKENSDYFDLIKLSHHGSSKNTTNKLAKILNTNIFLISTDGEGNHSHPDFETVAKIIYHQKGFKKIIFNYKTKTSELVDNTNWKEKYNYNVEIADGTKPVIIKL